MILHRQCTNNSKTTNSSITSSLTVVSCQTQKLLCLTNSRTSISIGNKRCNQPYLRVIKVLHINLLSKLLRLPPLSIWSQQVEFLISTLNVIVLTVSHNNFILTNDFTDGPNNQSIHSQSSANSVIVPGEKAYQNELK